MCPAGKGNLPALANLHLSCTAPCLAFSPQKRIELVDAYARVIAMIEIEVEMDTDLPAAEVLGARFG